MSHEHTDKPLYYHDRNESKSQIVWGGKRAAAFVREVVAGKAVDGVKYDFGRDLILAIHARVALPPGQTSFLRETNSTLLIGEPVLRAEEVRDKFYLYSRWLKDSVDKLKENPEDIRLALGVAAAAHYGLTQPGLHPFDGGNGRTARALVNAILMSQTYELTAYNSAIPPVPILRDSHEGNHYIKSLTEVNNSKILNPFMVFLAEKWVQYLEGRLERSRIVAKKSKWVGDKALVEKLTSRKKKLLDFVDLEDRASRGRLRRNDLHTLYPVPDYFRLQRLV